MAIIRILESHLISGSGISSQLRSAFVSDYVQKMILNPSKPIKQCKRESVCVLRVLTVVYYIYISHFDVYYCVTYFIQLNMQSQMCTSSFISIYHIFCYFDAFQSSRTPFVSFY